MVQPVSEEHACGCLMGAFIGDATGATLEFTKGPLSHVDVQRAMRLEGGGRLNVGPGQVTDDSELAMALAGVLSVSPLVQGFPLDGVATAYTSWFRSNPFDCGMTCARAMQDSAQHRYPIAAGPGPGLEMMYRAAVRSQPSEANGALMRSTPIAIWTARTSVPVTCMAARLDAMLTHPSRVTQDCNALYCAAIAHLIRTPGDHDGALSLAIQLAEDEACRKVRGWMKDALSEESALESGHPNVGHVRWGFTSAFRHLALNSDYSTGMAETLVAGGDTDTNACIVGGMLGALHGRSGLPADMERTVLAFDCTDRIAMAHSMLGRERPARYRASTCFGLVRDMMRQ
jgi:ADP-ribosylglycohydrolase